MLATVFLRKCTWPRAAFSSLGTHQSCREGRGVDVALGSLICPSTLVRPCFVDSLPHGRHPPTPCLPFLLSPCACLLSTGIRHSVATTGDQAEATRHLQGLKAEECGAGSPRSPGAQQWAEASWGGKCVAEGTHLARGDAAGLPEPSCGRAGGAEGCGLGAGSPGLPREVLKPGRCCSSWHLSWGQRAQLRPFCRELCCSGRLPGRLGLCSPGA